MAVVRASFLICDGCGDNYCGDSIPQETGTEQREGARRQGWRTDMPGGRDLCDGCRP